MGKEEEETVWRVKCPKCGAEDDLYVVRGVFMGSIPLSEDGFAFTDASRVDTEDEVVRCGVCGAEFPLGDLDADAVTETPCEDAAPEATVWVTTEMAVEGFRFAFYAARQALVEALAREAGLKVTWELGAGVVDVGVSGSPEQVGAFLKTLADAGIGRLVVDVKGAAPALAAAAAEASRELGFEVVWL